MPVDPMLFAARLIVKGTVSYWPARVRLAWQVLTGQTFTLACYADDVTVERDGKRVRLVRDGGE